MFPEYEWVGREEEEPQYDADGFCRFCGEHESKCNGYKCWR